MFALTFLGTSASVPSAERNHPGLLVETGSQRILVDCGEGTQRQLLRAGAGFRRLDRLQLTQVISTTCSAFPVSFRRCVCDEAPI
jgi:ribonuclease Z